MMDGSSSVFEKYVIRSILSNNEYGIKTIANLISLNSISFVRNQYQEIQNLIIGGDLKKVESLPFGIDNNEFLEIMKFNDQENSEFIVTVYDSIRLEQDPQVIDIYKIQKLKND